MNDRTRRRRFPIVNKSHQYRILALILIYLFIIVACVAAFLLVPELIMMQDESLSLEIRAFFADKVLFLHKLLWPVIICLIAGLGLHSFLVFLRFFGPLYRFCWAFEQVCKGNLSFRVAIRKIDYLHSEKEVLNEMIEMVAKKMKTIQLASLDAVKSIDELERTVAEVGNCEENTKESLLNLRRHLDILADTASYFRLQNSEQGPEGSET